MIYAFIAEHKARFGVASICRVLTEHGCKIAPRTYYAQLQRAPSKRALWDAVITEVLAGYYEPDEHGRRRPECLYGAAKMWAHFKPARHRGRAVHGGAADAGQRLALGCCGGPARLAPPSRTGRGQGRGPGRP